MNINISAVSGRREASIPFSFKEKLDGLSGYSQEAVLTTPVSLDGEVIKEGDVYYVTGKGSAGVSMPCDRCLEPVAFSIDFELDEKFSSNASYDEEIETFSGDSIDLTSSVIRNILAVLPMKVVCRDDCKGLFTVCGQNLNIKDCGCDTTYIDPRFESLRSLLKFDEEV